MNTKQTATALSFSALAAGMAQGAIVYSDINPDRTLTVADTMSIDLNSNGDPDFQVRFDGLGTMNASKPFINNSYNTEGAFVLARPDAGLPATEFGSMIDSSYLSTNKNGYLYQNYDKAVVGSWPDTANTEGYVGVELMDGSGNVNFGWVRMSYNASDPNNKTLTVKGFAYEQEPGVGIVAGATNRPASPDLYDYPQSTVIGGGANIDLKVVALANPAPTYQWMARAIGGGTFTNIVDGDNVHGANTAKLSITNATTANNAEYQVVVSNNLGSQTTPPATLQVTAGILNPPTPSSEQLYEGRTAQFHISMASGTPLSYQWRKDGAPLVDDSNISGAQAPDLLVRNVTSASAGQYDVVVTTKYGQVTSSPVPFALIPKNGGSFENAVLTLNPIAYYRLNETDPAYNGNVIAYDWAGGYNGTNNVSVHNGVEGPRPSSGLVGFVEGNLGAEFYQNTSDSRISVAPWNLNTNTATFVAWVYPKGYQYNGSGIVYTRSVSNMVCGLTVGETDDSGNTPLTYNWNDQYGAYAWKPSISIPWDQWSMVALVVTPTNATIYALNNNKLSSAVNTMPHAVQSFNDREYIGADPAAAAITREFNGVIDEVAVFNKSLTQDQVAGLYAIGIGLPALPPTITMQPMAQVLFTNQTAHFVVQATGSQPLSYQWYFSNGGAFAAIPSATNSSMTIANVGSANVGNYYVTVSNSGGNATSTTVPLTLSALSGEAAQRALLALGPVAYYELNEVSDPANGNAVAFDYVGGYNGIYAQLVTNGYAGVAGPRPVDGLPGFSSGNLAAKFTPAPNYQSRVTIPPLNLNTNCVTFTAWINPEGIQQPYAGLVFCRPGNSSDKSGFFYTANTNAAGETCLGYQWNDEWLTYTWDSGIVPPTNQWSFVALVISPTNAGIWMFNTNGVVSSVRNFNHAPSSFITTTSIGSDAMDEGTNHCFTGSMDNVAIFNKSLTENQLLNLFALSKGLLGAEPVISQQPQDLALFAGRTAKFSVNVKGSEPFAYRWMKQNGTSLTPLSDGSGVTGTTSDTLTISSVGTGNVGNYCVVITNIVGSVTSSVSTLTLVTPSSYQSLAMSSGAIALYGLNETANPAAGTVLALENINGMNGVYGSAVITGTPGPRPADGFDKFDPANTAALFVPAPNGASQVRTPAFHLNANNVTLSAWIYPTAIQNAHAGIVFSRGSGNDVSGLGFGTNSTGTLMLGYHWNDTNTTYEWNSGVSVPINQWSFVSLVVTPQQAVVSVMNTNGTLSATNAIPHDPAAFDSPITIGNDTIDATTNRCFIGVIDQVGIFANALSTEQLTALYNTARTPVVSQPVKLDLHAVANGIQLQWTQGTLLESTNIAGPWTTNSSPSGVIVTPSEAQKYYRIRVQ